MSKFKNMRFDVRDAEHSKQIQEYLFSLGYQWEGHGKYTANTSSPSIVADINGYLYNGSPPEYQLYELHVEMIPKYTIVPVHNTVKVGDKTYYEDELAEALSKIKPVDK